MLGYCASPSFSMSIIMSYSREINISIAFTHRSPLCPLISGGTEGRPSGSRPRALASVIFVHFHPCTRFAMLMISFDVGGAVFPIMLPRLFSLVGFGWAVRISGFVCLACCSLAIASITRRRPPQATVSSIGDQPKRKWIDLASLKDIRFVLLTTGSTLVSFGEPELKYFQCCHSRANRRGSPL